MTNNKPWATIITGALVLIVAVVGGLVVLIGDDGALTFTNYIQAIVGLAVACGLLGVGRGIAARK